MTMITSRGCPFDCVYCSKAVFGRSLRLNSARRVLEEVSRLKAEYGVEEIHFYDDVFTVDRSRIVEICQGLLRQGLEIEWSCTTRVDLVDRELLELMKSAGCWLISYGVESGNADVLSRAEKRYTLRDIRETFRLTMETGIQTLGFFMFGLPGDTLKTARETIRFALEIDPDYAAWSITTVLPGSRLHKMSYGTAGNLMECGTECESRVSHPFMLGEKVAIYQESMDIRTLNRLFLEGHRRFYLRGRFFLRFLRNAGGLKGLWRIMLAGLELLVMSLVRRD